jgi:hypothetical protein
MLETPCNFIEEKCDDMIFNSFILHCILESEKGASYGIQNPIYPLPYGSLKDSGILQDDRKLEIDNVKR